MKRNVNPNGEDGPIGAILAEAEELIPSSGFLAATMERVREEAAIPKTIPFPWLRTLPGIVVLAGVLGWCGTELVRTGLADAREITFAQLHLTAAAGRALESAGWVAGALLASMFSWLLSRRLAGRSGLI